MKFSNSKYISLDLGLLIIRLCFGFIMAYNNGLPKLDTYSENADEFYNFFGIGSHLSLALTIFAELICSLFLILGLFTRYALIPLIITFLVVVFMVHAGDSLADLEHALLYLLTYIALFLTGPGKFSVDYRFKL